MPRHTKRIRIDRKALRQPDEFHTLTSQATNWAGAHQMLLVGIAGAALVVAVVAFGVSRYRTSQNDAAAAQFRSAHETFAAGKFDEAGEAFATVASEHGDTAFGQLAALYRAHALARKNDASAAASAYGEYLAGSPTGYLRQEALVGLGRAKEAGGDKTAALDAYVEAGALDGPYRTDALLSAARLHEGLGQGDKAQAIYAGLMKDAGDDTNLKSLLLAKLPGAPVPPPPAATPQ
jgi:hypothetical protein